MFKIAVSKGRTLDEALPILAAAGIRPAQDLEHSRKLIIDTDRDDVQLVVIRAQDVPTFVAYGAADLGIAGKDVLLEHGGEGLYEPLDLGIAKCKLVVAGPKDSKLPTTRMRVATKYVNTTRRYFAKKGMQVEIIKLYGSMELAPLVGLAHHIVDVMDTGKTLHANGLVALEVVADISTRLIANKAAMKMKNVAMKALIADFTAAVSQQREH